MGGGCQSGHHLLDRIQWTVPSGFKHRYLSFLFSVLLCTYLFFSLNPVPASSSCVMTSTLLATPAATPCTPRRLSLRPSESSTNLRYGSNIGAFAPSTCFIVVVKLNGPLDFSKNVGGEVKGQAKRGKRWAQIFHHFSVFHWFVRPLY